MIYEWEGLDENYIASARKRSQTVAVLEVALNPLSSCLPLISGFYLDDSQLGWEIFQTSPDFKFEDPTHLVFCAGFPTQENKNQYDVLEFRIPVKRDESGLLIADIYDYNKIMAFHAHDNCFRKEALRHIAGFANSSFGNRDLPRLKDNDPALVSFLRANDISLGSTYKLSDVTNFSFIEDILFHPTLKDDLPEEFKNTQGLNLDALKPGHHALPPPQKIELREAVETSPYEFKMQTHVRAIDLAEPAQATQPDLQKPEPYTSLICQQPGWLARIFKKEASRRIDLFNEFSHQLSFFGLRIISHLPDDKNPLNAKMIFENLKGEIRPLTTKLEDYSDPMTRSTIFHVKGESTDYNKRSKNFSFHESDAEGKNLKSFANDMAEKTSMVFQNELRFDR